MHIQTDRHTSRQTVVLMIIVIVLMIIIIFFFTRLQMDQASTVEPAPEPSARATRGPGGPASRWASFVLGVLGYRMRTRRQKLRTKDRALVGEIGSLQWVSARLLSRAAPSSCDVPLPNLD